MKTNKSFSKRLKVTRNGKVVGRKSGHNHFNAKERGRTKGTKNRTVTHALTTRVKRRFLPGT